MVDQIYLYVPVTTVYIFSGTARLVRKRNVKNVLCFIHRNMYIYITTCIIHYVFRTKVCSIQKCVQYRSGFNTEVCLIQSAFNTEVCSIQMCVQYRSVFNTEVCSIQKCVQYRSVFNKEVCSIQKCVQYRSVFNTEVCSASKDIDALLYCHD